MSALTAPLIAQTDSDLPSIAVYVAGDGSASENDALASRLLGAIVRSGRYTAIERTKTFLAEIDREMLKQAGGSVDDAQVRRLGMQAGVQYVCVVSVRRAFDGYQVSARILDVETARVMAVADAGSRSFRTMDDLNRIAAEIVDGMFGGAVGERNTAAGLMPLVPGLAQMSRGYRAKGWSIIAGEAVLVAGIAVAHKLSESYRSDMERAQRAHNAQLARSYENDVRLMKNMRTGMIAGAAALYLYNIVDGYVLLSGNRRPRPGGSGLGLAPYADPQAGGLILTLNF